MQAWAASHVEQEIASLWESTGPRAWQAAKAIRSGKDGGPRRQAVQRAVSSAGERVVLLGVWVGGQSLLMAGLSRSF